MKASGLVHGTAGKLVDKRFLFVHLITCSWILLAASETTIPVHLWISCCYSWVPECEKICPCSLHEDQKARYPPPPTGDLDDCAIGGPSVLELAPPPGAVCLQRACIAWWVMCTVTMGQNETSLVSLKIHSKTVAEWPVRRTMNLSGACQSNQQRSLLTRLRRLVS